MSNAGASFPAPSIQQSAQEDSLHILLERAKESHQTVISAFSGHEDCVAVRSIWTLGNKPVSERSERDSARIAPYIDLVAQISVLQGVDDGERLRLLTQAKTLQDINHALAYEDIQAVVKANELSIVAYFEDVVKDPHRLYIFDPEQNIFVHTTIRLKEFQERPELLEQYALKAPIDVAAFIDEKASIYIKRRYEKAMKAVTVPPEDLEGSSPRVVALRGARPA